MFTIGMVVTLGPMAFFHIYDITDICCDMLRHNGKMVVDSRLEGG
jgi:4-coumarate--CoA ligase